MVACGCGTDYFTPPTNSPHMGGEKFWLVSRTAANVEKLMDWGFDVTTDLYQMVHPIIVK